MDKDNKKAINPVWQSIRAVLIFLAIVIVLLFMGGQAYGPWQMRGHAESAVGKSAPLQRRVEEFHARHKAFPDAATASAFAMTGAGMWKGTEWDAHGQALVVTIGDDRQLELKPKPGPAGLEWRCRSRSVSAHNTPRICRDD